VSFLTEQKLSDWIQSNSIAVVYFKSQTCGVCHVLLSKIEVLTNKLNIPLQVVDLTTNLHLAASQMVLNVPVTKVFHHQKEIWKEGAYQNLERLENLLLQLKNLDHEESVAESHT